MRTEKDKVFLIKENADESLHLHSFLGSLSALKQPRLVSWQTFTSLVLYLNYKANLLFM